MRIGILGVFLFLLAGSVFAEDVMIFDNKTGQGEVLFTNEMGIASAPTLGSGFRPNLSQSACCGGWGIAVSAAYVDGERRPMGLVRHANYQSKASSLNGWEGLLIVNKWHARIVPVEDFSWLEVRYNLRKQDDLFAFLKKAEVEDLHFIQLPLVLDQGVAIAPENVDDLRAVRRLLVMGADDTLSIYQTDEPATLHEAANMALEYMADWEDLNREPLYALNLPVGDYDYCVEWSLLQIENCGLNNPEREVPVILMLENGFP